MPPTALPGRNTTAATQTFTVDYENFDTQGNSLTGIKNLLTVSNLNPAQELTAQEPAWTFRGAGVSGGAPIYGSAIFNTASGLINFQTYDIQGNSVFNFNVTPNLSAYAAGATDQITQEMQSANHTFLPVSLFFTPNNGGGYSFAWNDTVTDNFGTHDQVEFAIYDSAHNFVAQQEFQIPDGQAQNIRIFPANIQGTNVELLAYGDDTGTHVIEFNSSGVPLASIFDPSTETFGQFTVLGDGRVALLYDDPLGADGTTQYVTHIYDLRQFGLNVNWNLTGSISGTTLNVTVGPPGTAIAPGETVVGPGILPNTTITSFGTGTGGVGTYTVSTSQTVASELMSLVGGNDKYFAGTQFHDSVTGENNVNNIYYYDGGSADSFVGATAQSWNIAIVPDARSDYTTSSMVDGAGTDTGGSGTFTNISNPQHTLTVTNVQELVFNPASDPDLQNGAIVANGGTTVLLGPVSHNVTVDSNSTLELHELNGVYRDNHRIGPERFPRPGRHRFRARDDECFIYGRHADSQRRPTHRAYLACWQLYRGDVLRL